jgi:hypothetical protein
MPGSLSRIWRRPAGRCSWTATCWSGETSRRCSTTSTRPRRSTASSTSTSRPKGAKMDGQDCRPATPARTGRASGLQRDHPANQALTLDLINTARAATFTASAGSRRPDRRRSTRLQLPGGPHAVVGHPEGRPLHRGHARHAGLRACDYADEWRAELRGWRPDGVRRPVDGDGHGPRRAGPRQTHRLRRRPPILWDHHSETIFRRNPNVARPGSERDPDLEWVAFYKGHRIYNSQDRRERPLGLERRLPCQPGEMFFNALERGTPIASARASSSSSPTSCAKKGCAPNKDWGRANYQQVATLLLGAGYDVAQFRYDGQRAAYRREPTGTTRHPRRPGDPGQRRALHRPEGGLHHGAAAAGIPAVSSCSAASSRPASPATRATPT